MLPLERSPGRASCVMEWVPKRGDEGSVATACFTAGLCLGAVLGASSFARWIARMRWCCDKRRVFKKKHPLSIPNPLRYWFCDKRQCVAGDELQTRSPIDKLCWTFTVQKCQYCLAPAADTLHLLMKVCASSPSCSSCLLNVRVTLEGGALGA